MKCPPCASGTRISRLFKVLGLIAAVKLAVFLALALDLAPLPGRNVPLAAVAQAASEAKTPPAAETKAPTADKAPAATTKAPAGEKAPAAENAPAPATPATPAQPGEPAPAASQTEPAGPPADWKALKRKEEELARKEQSLQVMEKDLEERLARLIKLEGQIKAMLEEAKGMKDEKFRHLVDVYANMKAQQAAQALESLDEDTAVKILAGMRGRQAGEILNYVSSKKAAVFSQALTQMQVPFSK
jgi:flagellar motility protein MotE (MotC chaperone)